MNKPIKLLRNFQHLSFISLISLLFLFSCQEPNYYENYAWTGKVRHDHPRLFLNKKSFPEIKNRALDEEKENFNNMKSRVDELIGKKIEFKEPYVIDGTQNRDHEYGMRASEAAFVYMVLKDKKYLDLCKDLLVNLIDYYKLRNKAQLNIQWYAFSTINTLVAYDWIYNDLTRQERTEMGSSLLTAINDMLPAKGRKAYFRENTGGPTTGFYGPPSLAWYAGLLFHNEGINDTLAEKIMKKGYDDYIALLNHRSKISGDDGGSASAVLGYCMGAYPWAEFNFFHTFSSATGLDIAREWLYVPHFLNYVFWNWLPGDKEYGYGDTRHYTNAIPLGSMYMHISQMIHFYGETQPDLTGLAKWMLPKVQRQQQEVFPFARFLLTKSYENIQPQGPSEKTPKARHFENMGQIFIRSGSGPDDTYALFTAGGSLVQHRHYDNNNFVIFKKGFLILDTSTRPEPGIHLTHYFCRTIAHNCILINMPGEKMPVYWGGPAKNEAPEPIPNDGGQREILGSEITGFDESDNYVYIASDATKSYHKDKANLVLRQFIFLPPDHFVVFDRVTSTKPEYKKTWLLHFAKEPAIKSNEFSAKHWGGRIFGRTIFPEKAKISKIGGPGRQFWSDGKNWPLPTLTPDDWNYKRSTLLPDTSELLGQWRIEVSPEKFNNEDIFLHLLQVGDNTLTSMVSSKSIRTEDHAGLRFAFQDKEFEILFALKNAAAGKISIFKSGQKVLEENFTDKVKPQKGL
jgi:hypothetical protein